MMLNLCLPGSAAAAKTRVIVKTSAIRFIFMTATNVCAISSRPILGVSSLVDASIKLLQISRTHWLNNFPPTMFGTKNLTIMNGGPSLPQPPFKTLELWQR